MNNVFFCSLLFIWSTLYSADGTYGTFFTVEGFQECIEHATQIRVENASKKYIITDKTLIKYITFRNSGRQMGVEDKVQAIAQRSGCCDVCPQPVWQNVKIRFSAIDVSYTMDRSDGVTIFVKCDEIAEYPQLYDNPEQALRDYQNTLKKINSLPAKR